MSEQQTNNNSSGATSQHDAAAKRSFLDRLTAVGNIIVALMAIFATAISLVTLRMQAQDRATAARDRSAAAYKARTNFATHIVIWWTADSNSSTVDFHIQNDNGLPVRVWIVKLDYDKKFTAENSAAQFTSKHSYSGGTGYPFLRPYVTLGEVPPCTGIQVHAPFVKAEPAVPTADHPSQVEGDIVFVDPSGSIWAIDPPGVMRPIRYNGIYKQKPTANYVIANILSIGSIGIDNSPIKWNERSRSPICG